MQNLRNAHLTARLVLVWFALAMGVAVAAPLVQPKGMQLVCSATGAISVQFDQGDGGGAGPQSNTLDCPLCASVGAPPAQVSVQVLTPMGLCHVLRIPDSQPSVRRSAAPLPPRGPPATV